jgi:arylsulfatase A-like enzyme
MPLVRGDVDRLHEAIFTETTYHAAYQPHRAVRTERWKYIRRFDDYEHPILANCDDSASKDLLVAAGWGDQAIPEEQLYDLILDPAEGNNRSADPACGEVLAEMRGRLDAWMRETDDPLLDGPVEPPPGAAVNEQWQNSPNDPVRIVQSA